MSSESVRRAAGYPFQLRSWIPVASLIVQPCAAVLAGILRLLGRRQHVPAVLRLPLPGPAPSACADRSPWRAVVTRIVPGAAVACVVAYLAAMIPVNVLYPLRPDTTAADLNRSWGGPTLAGAWAVHVALIIPILWLCPLLARPLAFGMRKISGDYSGTYEESPPRR